MVLLQLLVRQEPRVTTERSQPHETDDTSFDEHAEGQLIERRQPLSRSVLWRLQRAYFAQRGVEAWSRGEVPHYITSNPFVAGAYARIVAGYLRDLTLGTDAHGQPLLDRGQPVYLVEIGSGAGRFAYNLLQRLDEALSDRALDGVRLVVVMTDVAERNLAFWRDHPRLAPYFAAGRLDLAEFDAEHDATLHLERAGITLAPSAPANPLIIVANYVFDSIAQDAFRVRGGYLYESLVTVTSPCVEPDADDPEILSRITVDFEHRPITGSYYDDEGFDAVLESYRRSLPDAALQLPVGALHLLRATAALSSDRALVLSSDKGYHREEDLLDRGDPTLAYHGSFSMAVNYHALGAYVRHRGGVVLHPPHGPTKLCVAAYVLGLPDGCASTSEAYDATVGGFGPDDFFALKTLVMGGLADATLEQFLALLRLSGWDGKLVLDGFAALQVWVRAASPSRRADVVAALDRAWKGHFPIGEERDLAVHLALLLIEMDRFAEAIVYCRRSVEERGPTALGAYARGCCHHARGEHGEALTEARIALDLDADFELARALRIRAEGAARAAIAPPMSGT